MSSINPTRLYQRLRRSHRHIGLWHGHHTLTRGRNSTQRQNNKTPTTSNRILLGLFHTSRMKLQHLRKRTISHSESTQTLATSPSRIKKPLHRSHGPCQPGILERIQRSKPKNSQMAWIFARLLVQHPSYTRKEPFGSRLLMETPPSQQRCGR